MNFEDYRRTRSLSSFDVTHNFVFSYSWMLPFDKVFANAPKRLTQGWNLSGVTRFTGGFPSPSVRVRMTFHLQEVRIRTCPTL